jgi:glyoxylase-like metal-dependent hydrolase (beta-lactamase superfamily II)
MTEQVRNGIHRLGSPLVNWYLVEEDDRLTAVDAGLPGFVKGLEAQLAAIGRRPADVEAVILTHSDADHTGVAATLREAGARVLIHSEDDETLRNPGPKTGDAHPKHFVTQLHKPAFWRFFYGMARAGGARPTAIEGAEHFGDGDELDVPGKPRVVATPGHTPGHCSFVFADHDALFVGDSMCTSNPLTRGEGPEVMPKVTNVSDERAVISLDAMENLEASVILPGHGEPWHGSPAAAVHRARAARGT